MVHASYFYDTKTLIVNLLKEDDKAFLNIDRLHDLLRFIYIKLQKQNKLDDYQMLYDVYFDALERTVIYNGDIFFWDIDENTIYLKDKEELEIVYRTCILDDTLESIVKEFVAKKPVLEVL